MAIKTIGIIGNSGRMGQFLQEKINNHTMFNNGIGFNLQDQDKISLKDVFNSNNYIIDFSNQVLLQDILKTAIENPKPILICTTGWQENNYRDLLTQLSKKTTVVLATNTSIGAFLQRQLVRSVAKILGEEYDIDIIEKHHRNKVDFPSGTAQTLINDIKEVKKDILNKNYQESFVKAGIREDNTIGIAVQRAGNIIGEHEVIFTSDDEMISIKHQAFSRGLFAQGALKIIETIAIKDIKSGIYHVEDIIQ